MYVRIKDISKINEFMEKINNHDSDLSVGLVSASLVFSCYNLVVKEIVKYKGVDKVLEPGLYFLDDLIRILGEGITLNKNTGRVSVDSKISMSDKLRDLITNGGMFGGLRSLTFELAELSTNDNFLNGSRCNDLYTWHVGDEIYFGKMVNIEPINIQYKKLRGGGIDYFNIAVKDQDGELITFKHPIEVVLHVKKL